MERKPVREIAEALFADTKRQLENGEEIIPQAWLIERREALCIQLHFHDTPTKRAAYLEVQRLISERRPEAVILIQDTWMKVFPRGARSEAERLDQEGVASQPDKGEALVMQVSDRNAEDLTVLQPYERLGRFISWMPRDETTGYSPDTWTRLLPPDWKTRPPADKIPQN